MVKLALCLVWFLVYFVGITAGGFAADDQESDTFTPQILIDLFNQPPRLKPLTTEEREALELRAGDEDLPDIEYDLGQRYYYGIGVAGDIARAAKWYRQAAENGNSNAMVQLGRMHRTGYSAEGVSRSSVRMNAYLRDAARLRNPKAWFEIGINLERGIGMEVDPAKALEAYEIAARQGVLAAKVKIALAYQFGNGTPRDVMKAVRVFEEIREATGNPAVKAQLKEYIGRVYYALAQESREPERQRYYYEQASSLGEEAASVFLGDAHRSGDTRIVVQDYDKAVMYYTRAADQHNNTYAMNMLGYMYGNGLGVIQNHKLALEWYTRSAENGSPEGAWNVGNIYFHGNGVTQDKDIAQQWFSRSEVLEQRKQQEIRRLRANKK